jgi:hypothetical protein
MKIEKVQVKNLKFAQYNPRFHSEEFLKKLNEAFLNLFAAKVAIGKNLLLKLNKKLLCGIIKL